MKKYFFIALAFSLFACNKLNEKRQFFGEWVVVKKERINENDAAEDITQECDKDDSETYRNMGEWYFDPGNEKCNEAELPIIGKWNYDSDNNRLVYSNNANINNAEARVQVITGDSMVLDLRTAGVEDIIRITYAKAK